MNLFFWRRKSVVTAIVETGPQLEPDAPDDFSIHVVFDWARRYGFREFGGNMVSDHVWCCPDFDLIDGPDNSYTWVRVDYLKIYRFVYANDLAFPHTITRTARTTRQAIQYIRELSEHDNAYWLANPEPEP